ncbi:MAG: KH domain-containing protein [Thermomicrobiales bacterium]
MSDRDDRDDMTPASIDDAFIDRDSDVDNLDGGDDDVVEPLADAFEADGEPRQQLEGLISYIVGNLVDEPDAVEIASEQRGTTIHLTVNVPEEELGKVIGRGGRIAKAIRTALTVAGSRHHLRVSLDIESLPAA